MTAAANAHIRHNLTSFLAAVVLLLVPLSPSSGGGPKLARNFAWSIGPSVVAVERAADGSFRYVVNGSPQVFVGMGYNLSDRAVADEERAERYARDFRRLAESGVNHLLGWDADKGYEHEKFDELTLDWAERWGLGVVMPFYLPADADYEDEALRAALREQATLKIERFKNHPALRMWAVGNEVLRDMKPWPERRGPFLRFYVELADLFYTLDPNHPVLYREAEDVFVPDVASGWWGAAEERPWLLYGLNAYTMRLDEMLRTWPEQAPGRPVVVTEFGLDPLSPEEGGRAQSYLTMWQIIRAYSPFVLGGAAYTWATDGPELGDQKWGMVGVDGQPVDSTLSALADEWLKLANPLPDQP